MYIRGAFFLRDAKQIQSLLKAALSHRGTAVIDVISPCVSFNDHEDSTKSYHWAENTARFSTRSVLSRPRATSPSITRRAVFRMCQLHSGSWIRLKKLDETHDPTDRISALRILEQARQDQVILTGLIYIDQDRPTAVESARMTQTPLTCLPEEALRPSEAVLEQAVGVVVYRQLTRPKRFP